MSTLVPVMCGWCVVCLVLCVWCGVGRWEGWEGEWEGGIDKDGWVLRPIGCDVWTLGCPKYTAKPLGRLIAKRSVVPAPLVNQYNTCGLCVVCGVCHVACVMWVGGATVSTIVCRWCALCVVACGRSATRNTRRNVRHNNRRIVVGAFVAWCPP